ncbi:MAG: DUF3987 domain-containing protein [Acidobacteriota bacterium]
MGTTATEGEQYAAAEIEGLITELADEVDRRFAEGVALESSVPLLAELGPAGRAVWQDELLRAVPSLEPAALTASLADYDRRHGRRLGRVSPNRVSPPQWKPFPTQALPGLVNCYVQEVATAIGCDESFAALPVLASLAGCIGNRRRVRLKRSWTEPAIIWAVVVARSGRLKSPAIAEVTRHLHQREAQEIETERQRRDEYELELRAWSDPPKGKRGERPEEPDLAVRLVVSDITVEALAERLSQAPPGLVRDELAGWVRSFDQYKAGRGGDAQAWLEMHRGGALIVDRKSGPTLSVPRAAVSIIGSVQPEVLRSTLSGEHMVNGLAARLLFTMPPEALKQWCDDDLSGAVRDDWAGLLDDLLGPAL